MGTRSLLIKPGCIGHLADALTGVPKLNEILFATDPVVDKLYGGTVMAQLEQLGHVRKVYVDYNTLTIAMDIAESMIADSVGCLVAMGGGKVLDVCKYAAFITKTPLMSIPTTVSNDGIASPVAALKQKDSRPRSLACTPPAILVMDPEIILAGPAQLVKAGIGDTLSKFTALDDWTFACDKGKDTMNGYAYMMAQTSLDVLLHSRHSGLTPDFIDDLAHSLVLSGISMEFAGSSRPVSGSEHLFSHALDFLGEKTNLHGLQVALGTVAVTLLMDEDPEPIVSVLKKFDIQVAPSALGISEDLFVRAMQQAPGMRKSRWTRLHEADLNSARLSELYRRVEQLLA